MLTKRGERTSAENAGFIKQVILLIKRNKVATSILSVVVIFFIVIITAFIMELQGKNIELSQNSTLLRNQKDLLEGRKEELERNESQLEKRTDQLQSTIDDLVMEKKRTEAERKGKEAEKKAKEKERLAKEIEIKAKERERQLKERERLLKVEERILRKKEQLAKEEEILKREEVSKISAPEFVQKSQAFSMVMKWDEAFDTIGTALSLDNSLDEAWYLKGRLYFGFLNFHEALASWEKSNILDEFGLKSLAEEYGALIAEDHGLLSAFELRQLSRRLRDRNDEILSNRIQQLALDKEREILARLNHIKQEVKKNSIPI